MSRSGITNPLKIYAMTIPNQARMISSSLRALLSQENIYQKGFLLYLIDGTGPSINLQELTLEGLEQFQVSIFPS